MMLTLLYLHGPAANDLLPESLPDTWAAAIALFLVAGALFCVWRWLR